jgi:hypothetical protein
VAWTQIEEGIKTSAYVKKYCSIQMVVEKYISIAEVSKINDKTLVCRFAGKSPSEEALNRWVDLHWKSVLGCSPVTLW